MRFRSVIYLWIFGLLLLSSTTQAYQLTCSWVFLQKVESFLKPDSPQRILKAIEDYKNIMGISDFNHKPSSMDDAKLRLNSMSLQEKENLLRLVGEYYNEVKALKYSSEGPFKTFKRHIDLVISQAIDAPKFFRYQIYKKNHSLEAALDAYYKRVQQVSKVPVLLSGADVLLTAMRLQEKFLKKKDDTIVMYGSFVNGKAYAHSSDLDFAVINGRLEQHMRGQDLLALLTDFPLSEAQAHLVSAKQVHSLGSMNPLVLIVRRDYIVLRVYEKGLHYDFTKKQVPFNEFYF